MKLYLPRYMCPTLEVAGTAYGTAEVYYLSINDLVGFSLFFGISGRNQPGDDDAEEVQSDHRGGEDGLRHHVAGGRDDGRQHENDEEGVLEVPREERRRDEPDLREEEDDRRHLEHEPHAYEHLRV